MPVGYSESIFQPLGEALGLRLLTPYSFAKSIAEGTEVTAQDKQTVDRQASGRQIKVWVLNSQNVTPDVQRVSELARAHPDSDCDGHRDARARLATASSSGRSPSSNGSQAALREATGR